MSRKLQLKTIYQQHNGQRVDIPAIKGKDAEGSITDANFIKFINKQITSAASQVEIETPPDTQNVFVEVTFIRPTSGNLIRVDFFSGDKSIGSLYVGETIDVPSRCWATTININGAHIPIGAKITATNVQEPSAIISQQSLIKTSFGEDNISKIRLIAENGGVIPALTSIECYAARKL